MHNAGNSLGKEEVAMQRKSPKNLGWQGGLDRKSPGGGNVSAHSPVSLRKIIEDR